MLCYGIGGQPKTDHHFRVKDVMYKLDNKPDHQAAILVEEITLNEQWA